MMKKVYKVVVNKKVFIRTISKDLAERTLAMAEAYNLSGEIIEAVEEYAPGNETL